MKQVYLVSQEEYNIIFNPRENCPCDKCYDNCECCIIECCNKLKKWVKTYNPNLDLELENLRDELWDKAEYSYNKIIRLKEELEEAKEKVKKIEKELYETDMEYTKIANDFKKKIKVEEEENQ